jgi:hypothetical protein
MANWRARASQSWRLWSTATRWRTAKNGTMMVGKMAIGQVVRAGGSRASPVALATRKWATPRVVKA